MLESISVVISFSIINGGGCGGEKDVVDESLVVKYSNIYYYVLGVSFVVVVVVGVVENLMY